MSNGVAFDSLESAKAAFSLGPVRFRCLCCGRTHDSGGRGWEDCAGKFAGGASGLRVVRQGGRPVYRLDVSARAVGSLPGTALLGREHLLPEEAFAWDVSAPAMPMPLLLALTERAFRKALREAGEAWWKEVLSKVALMAETLRRVFPGATADLRPAVPLPSLCVTNRYGGALRLPTAVLDLRDWSGGFPERVTEIRGIFYAGGGFAVDKADLKDRLADLVEAVEGRPLKLPPFPEKGVVLS